jgi:hypothetical protein
VGAPTIGAPTVATELIERSKAEVERALTLLDDTAKHVPRRPKGEPRER